MTITGIAIIIIMHHADAILRGDVIVLFSL